MSVEKITNFYLRRDREITLHKGGRFVLTKGRKGLPLDSSPVLDKLSFTLAKLTNCFVSV